GHAGRKTMDYIRSVGIKGRSLNHCRCDCTAANVDLIKAWSGKTGVVQATNGMSSPQRLSPTYIRILVLHHGANCQNIESIATRRRRIGRSCSWPASGSKWSIRSSKCREADLVPIDVELVYGVGVQEFFSSHVIVRCARRRSPDLDASVTGQ